ncbi:MAG: glycosyltransferase family 4 protein [Nanoarchaeota archaeon]|nr:glycosyltransferase family 4 protein [Nanoarchaeota archaeon]
MKILFLVTNFNFVGGKERYDKDLIRALQEGGVGLRVVRLSGRALPRKILFVLRACVSAVFFKPDVLFASHVSFSSVICAVNRFTGIPYVVCTAGTEVWDIKKESIKKALRNARLILYISDYTKEKMTRQMEELRKKMFFLPPSVREKLFTIRKKPESPYKTLLTVARLRPNEEEKGYLKVIDALPGLRKEFSNIRYIIVGAVLREFGDNTERIRAYARERGAAECVIVVGEVSDRELADYYNLCDVFVMPSTQEGFGIVFLEALASGKPVIAGNKDGSKDALLGGKLGILVDPDNVEEIAAAIVKVLKKQAPPEILDGNLLRKEMIEVYGVDKFKKRVIELVHELETT